MDSGSCFLSGEWMTGMGEQLRGTFDTVSRQKLKTGAKRSGVKGTGACRRQRRMKAGGASEIARSDRRARLCEFPGLNVPCGVQGWRP